jgi:CP family cyanate transporter-like MFS transporter
VIAGRRVSGDVRVLVALLVVATALRPQLVGIGPLLPRMTDDLGMPHWQAGLLGTIPVLCMGIFALPAGRTAARFGTVQAVGACVLVVASFGLARALVESAALLILLTIPVGIGMGLTGALLPVAAKERFRTRPALATGIYTTGIQVGAVAATVTAVPLATGASWHTALGVFSLAAAVGWLGWLALWPKAPRHERRTVRRDLRGAAARPEVWVVVAVFGLMSIVYYGLVAWLSGAYLERGWTETDAGALLGVLMVAQVPGGLLVAALADRGQRRRFFLGAAVTVAAGTAGLVAVPAAAWVWAAVVGTGIGALFPLVLTLPLDLADGPDGVAGVAGVVLGAGYSIAAVAPTALGALRDLTGSFSSALWSLVATAALLVVAAAIPVGRVARD